LIALLMGLAACVLPEPITEEPPPSNPDPGLQIVGTFPLERTVQAHQQSNGACTVDIGLTDVSDPSGAALTARFFLNDGNLDVTVDASQPLGFEGSGTSVTTDFALTTASETAQPPELDLPAKSIDLDDYVPFLVLPPSAVNVNFIEIVVSDGFVSPAGAGSWRTPATGKSVASAFWNIDLTDCPDLVP
jgi:hypothetical protein